MPKKNGKKSSKSGRFIWLREKIFGRSTKKAEDNPPLDPISPGVVIQIPDAAIRALPDGSYVKEDGKPLTMGDMEAQADKRNKPRGLGGLGGIRTTTQYVLDSRLLINPNSLAERFGQAAQVAQQADAQQRMQGALAEQVGVWRDLQQSLSSGVLFGVAGSTRIGPGIAADFGIEPEPEPKKEIKVPMQQPTGKRKIKLVD